MNCSESCAAQPSEMPSTLSKGSSGQTKKYLKRKRKYSTSYINSIIDPFLRNLFVSRPLVIEKMYDKSIRSIERNNLINSSLNWKNYYTKKRKFNNNLDFVKRFFRVLQSNFIGIVDCDERLRIFSLDGIDNDGTNIFDGAFSYSYDILKFSDILNNEFGIPIFVDEALYTFVFSIEEGKKLCKMFDPKYYDLSTGKVIAIDEEDQYYEFEVQ